MHKMSLEKLPNVNVPPTPRPPNEPATGPGGHAPVGPIVGIVIIIVILLLGALYFWGEQLRNKDSDAPAFIPGDQAQTP